MRAGYFDTLSGFEGLQGMAGVRSRKQEPL